MEGRAKTRRRRRRSRGVMKVHAWLVSPVVVFSL